MLLQGRQAGLSSLRWLSLDDDRHNDWHQPNFQSTCHLSDSRDGNLLEITLQGKSNSTPMTNFAGFRTLVSPSLRKSKIARGFADWALEVFGGVVTSGCSLQKPQQTSATMTGTTGSRRSSNRVANS